jgi:hypothetical protein
MKKINKPSFKVREVFIECISTINDVTLKANLNTCVDIIENAENDFDIRFPLNTIHEIVRNKVVNTPVGKKEMKTVYDYRMLKKEKPRKKYYDKILFSAPYGICPLCSVREVDTLDHYLPKSKYPIYAVTPINLIPSCFKCNKGKSIDYPTNSEEQTLNPYYDDIENVEWLSAEVLQTNPISFRYFVNPPADIEQILNDRMSNHFDSYQINELFSSHANEELRGVKKQLETLYNNNPSLLVSHLQDSYISRIELGMNSWQALMYKALLNDGWFCSGGVLTN